MTRSAQLRVYTDGNCAFCRWSRALIEPHDIHGVLDFRDYNQPEIAAETHFSQVELGRRMHVRTPDGNWHYGYYAWVELLRALPRYRWIGLVLSWAPIRWFGPVIYDFLAHNRYRVPGWVLRSTGAPAPCGADCRVPGAAQNH